MLGMLLVLEHRVHLYLGDFRIPLYYHLRLEYNGSVKDNSTICGECADAVRGTLSISKCLLTA